MKKSSQQFFAWADVVRIFAIVLVVLLHTFITTDLNTWQGWGILTMMVFAKVSVPLFIMLSGALLLPKIETWKVFIQKRLKRVVLPWVTWTLLLYMLLPANNLSISWFTLLDIFHSFSASFTYLPLIFCLYLLIPTFRIIVRDGGFSQTAYLIVIWFIAISFLPFARNSLAFPLSVDNGLVTQTIQFSGYILAGWLLSKVIITKKVTIFSFVGLVTSLIAWSTYLVQRNGNIDFTYSSYTSPMIIISSMILFLLLTNTIPDYSRLSATTQKAIRLLSKASFGVFLIHNSLIEVIRPFTQLMRLEPFIQNLVLWITVSFSSFAIIVLLYQLKPARELIT